MRTTFCIELSAVPGGSLLYFGGGSGLYPPTTRLSAALPMLMKAFELGMREHAAV
jgi:hypothetical protein